MRLLCLTLLGLLVTSATDLLTLSIGFTSVYWGDLLLLASLKLARYDFYQNKTNIVLALMVMATSITTQTTDSIYAWLFYCSGMLTLVGSAAQERRSLLGAMGHGVVAFTIGWVLNLSKMWRRLPELLGRFKIAKRDAALSLIPFFLTLVFINLYANANDHFSLLFSVPAEWLSDSNLASVIGPLCWFSLLSNVYVFPIYWQQLGQWESKQRVIMSPPESDVQSTDHEEEELEEFGDFSVEPFLNGPVLSTDEQRWVGTVLLGGLNALLLVFHVADIATLIGGALPKSMSYSAYLHQGINTLMLSIGLASVIVLTLFRGELNFIKEAENIRRLAKLWLMQNMLLLLTCTIKVTWYVDVYGLSAKRVGVISVLSAFAGMLVFTLAKVKHRTTLWHWSQQNTAWAMGVCGLFGLINWGQVITTINLHTELEVQPDIRYLLDLKKPNYPAIAEHLLSHPEQMKESLWDDLQLFRNSFPVERFGGETGAQSMRKLKQEMTARFRVTELAVEETINESIAVTESEQDKLEGNHSDAQNKTDKSEEGVAALANNASMELELVDSD